MCLRFVADGLTYLFRRPSRPNRLPNVVQRPSGVVAPQSVDYRQQATWVAAHLGHIKQLLVGQIAQLLTDQLKLVLGNRERDWLAVWN